MKSKRTINLKNILRPKRLIAAGVSCVAVTLALVILLSGSGVVMAKLSLPYIEELAGSLRGSGSFTILEIVQNVGDGYFGYYVDGEERDSAGRNWEDHVGTLSGDERKNYVDAMQSYLRDTAGVLGAPGTGIDAFPLTWMGDYTEYKPWINIPDTVNPADVKTLNLASFEREPVSGTITEEAGGGYITASVFFPFTAGEYILDVRELEYNYDGGAEYYFGSSQIRFTEVTFNQSPTGNADLLQYATDEGIKFVKANEPLYTEIDDSGTYRYFGTISGGLNFSGGIPEIYIVTDYGPAYETAAAAGSDYYAVISPASPDDSNFLMVSNVQDPAGGARFSREINLLRYAGTGEGTHSFAYDPSGTLPDIIIDYNIVYYTGGFRNNNWFLRHVLDREQDELTQYSGKINVISAAYNDPDLGNLINSADMIVLAEGLTGLSGQHADVIYSRAASDANLPVIFAYSLNHAGGEVGTLVRNLASKSAGGGSVSVPNGVNENIFWTERPAGNLLGNYTDTGPFNAVIQEIDNENFLREQQGITDMLERDNISNATAIRYILNFGKRRQEHKWDKINVLEIQGGLTGTGSTSDLTEAKVREWIGDVPPYKYSLADGTLTITRMTTYEFVGRIEDLNETYHMIYIGGTARGMNPVTVNGQEEARYNDPGMNPASANGQGLVYTNIGDRYSVNSTSDEGGAMQGLVAGDSDKNFRLSGNDITPSKMRDILDFAKAGYPVIIDNRLIVGEVGENSTTTILDFDFSIAVEGGQGQNRWGRYELKIDGAPQDAVFTWHCFYMNGANRVNVNVNPTRTSVSEEGQVFEQTFYFANTNPTLINNTIYYFYCEVEYEGETYIFLADKNDLSNLSKYTIRIYRNGQNFRFLTPDGQEVSVIGDTGEITGTPGTVNEQRVDNCSYMFETLNNLIVIGTEGTGVSKYKNVFTANAAAADPESVNRYLNLSKPRLILHSQPTPYFMDGAGNMNVNASGRFFTYGIEIENLSDATPGSTTYDLELFLDINGDGRYEGSSEKQTDIMVRQGSASGSVVTPVSGRYRLYAGTRYFVTKQMPQSAVGLYDWCLKITKNDTADTSNRTVRASQQGFTRIAPADELSKKTINILQIASSLIPSSSNGDFSYKGPQQRTNFEWQQRSYTSAPSTSGTGMPAGQSAADYYLRGKDGLYYEGIYGKLIADVDDFNINIYTVYANELDNLSLVNNRTGNARTELNTYLETRDLTLGDTLDDIFAAFDMLIIGFDDSYGNLSGVSARAIADYIKSGKATLFAHDAVTFFNNPSAPGAYGVDAAFILRNATGLDRYGITNSNFFNRPYGGEQLLGGTISALLNSNYSVGWTPKSGKSSTVRDIQGFNYHILKWYHDRSDTDNTNNRNTFSSFMNTKIFPGGEDYGQAAYNGTNDVVGRRTNMVSQLNEGKITTYPYDVNIYAGNPNIQSAALAGMGMANVGETHGQYYTVNMNLEDIVVWYCLKSDYYIYNDAANAYYIYNSGNITYTGAGHSMNQGVTTGRNTSRNSPSPAGGNITFGTNYSNSDTLNITRGIEFEAKLFVNTMIAAYRVTDEPPEVYTTNANDVEIKVMLLPWDENELNTDLSVYFRILDSNLETGKSVSLNLGYYLESNPDPFARRLGELISELPEDDYIQEFHGIIEMPEVYGCDDSGNPVTGDVNGALQNDRYCLKMPDEILELLEAAGEGSAVILRLEAATNLSSKTLYGHADLVIRRINLFPLG